MAEVVLENISKVYEDTDKKRGRKKAIDNISFTVKDKEFMVIVGPSGCGKSTLLRMIAGLEDITEGTLSIDGKIINDISPGDRDIAMVFQNYALYPHMTVYDNMAFGLKIKNYSKKEIKERVLQTAQLLEIEDELYRKPKTLSGGQRQRVAIGRAIIRRPKVFLFDEPLSNLDAKLRSQMRIELQRLHREINATMIYVTHDQTEAMTLGNRIAVLNKGNLMQLDTPMNLYSKPANKFVAGFIGSPAMNFISGILKKTKDEFYLEIDSECMVLLGTSLPSIITEQIDRKIEVGIRPENIILEAGNFTSTQCCQGIVVAFENMGNEQLIYLSPGGQKIIVRRTSEEVLEIGATVSIRFKTGEVIYIDSSSENIIESIY